MDHHGVVHVVEHSGVQHLDLSTAALFRGGAEKDAVGGKPVLSGQPVKNQGGVYAGGRDQVVAAGVPHRKGVVLRNEGNVQIPGYRGVLGAESGVKLTFAPAGGKALGRDGLLQQGGRVLFVKGQLRVGEDVAAHGENFGSCLVHQPLGFAE